MGFFDSVKDFGGGRFAGEMTSEGSGARIRAGVRDIPIIGDVDLVNVHVPGFRDGGVVGDDKGAGRRQGGRDAPTSRRKALRTVTVAGGDRRSRVGPARAPACVGRRRR